MHREVKPDNTAFDAWVADRLAAREEPALLDYATRAPHVGEAVPSSEYFDPLFFVLGASRTDDRLETVHAGFQYANLSMRCVAFESS